MDDFAKHNRRREGSLPILLWALLAIGAFGFVLGRMDWEFEPAAPPVVEPAAKPRVNKPSASQTFTDEDDGSEEFGGLKQADPSDDFLLNATPQPIEKAELPPVVVDTRPTGSISAEPLAVRLGEAASIPDVYNLYARIEKRAPFALQGLTAMRQADEAGDGQYLVVGPFASDRAQGAFCRTMRLKLLLDCQAADMRGQPLL